MAPKPVSLAVASTVAFLGALVLWGVWDALANAYPDIVKPRSEAYFLPVVCIWAAICLGFGVLLPTRKLPRQKDRPHIKRR